MYVCATPNVRAWTECESVRVTRRLCAHVCLLALCVCACHSKGVWVEMSVCHGEGVLVMQREKRKLGRGERGERRGREK